MLNDLYAAFTTRFRLNGVTRAAINLCVMLFMSFKPSDHHGLSIQYVFKGQLEDTLNGWYRSDRFYNVMLSPRIKKKIRKKSYQKVAKFLNYILEYLCFIRYENENQQNSERYPNEIIIH